MLNLLWIGIGAAWVAVLIPPLLRSRLDNRPNSSITDFRRQLSSLQRTVPTKQVAPMRALVRPLTQTGQPRTVSKVNAPTVHTRVSLHHQHGGAAGKVMRQHGEKATPPRAERLSVHRNMSRATQRELARRRRMNLFMVLAASTATLLVAALSTKNSTVVVLFMLAAVGFAGYCYKLLQLKANEHDERSYREFRQVQAQGPSRRVHRDDDRRPRYDDDRDRRDRRDRYSRAY